jgi:hypothetical protein
LDCCAVCERAVVSYSHHLISRGDEFSFVDIMLDYYPGIQQGGGSCLLGGNRLRKLLHQAQARKVFPLWKKLQQQQLLGILHLQNQPVKLFISRVQMTRKMVKL